MGCKRMGYIRAAGVELIVKLHSNWCILDNRIIESTNLRAHLSDSFIGEIAGQVSVQASFPLSRFYGFERSGEVSFAVGGADANTKV